MRVAVLGAGFQGTCVAIELAGRGVDVDLFDRNDICITQAGLANEGKVHLGYVYANDPTFATADLMAQGALIFGDAIERWTESSVTSIGVSTDFDYIVHRDSMVPADAIASHFAMVDACVRERIDASGRRYLGAATHSLAARMPAARMAGVYDPDSIAAAFTTSERSIHVERLAERLRARVAGEPRIDFLSQTQVLGIAADADGYRVDAERDGNRISRAYRHVVNCLWDGKLELDRQLGLLPRAPWLHRLKYGVRLRLTKNADAIPSVTITLGRYGDVVRFDEMTLYMSWYPACLAGKSSDVSPPDWPRRLCGDAAASVTTRTIAGLAEMILPMRMLDTQAIERAAVAGGIILAAGASDIDDPASGLHRRTAVGVRTSGGYHSVDTGKYTLAPMFAIEAANRVLGVR